MIRLLFTSDIHGNIVPYSYADGSSKPGGLARLAAVINERRDSDTVVIDGGDTIEGSPLTFYHALRGGGGMSPVTRAVRKTEYDFAVLGNHDFTYGYGAMEDYLMGSGVACLTANAKKGGEYVFPPYVIRRIGGASVAFTGASTHFISRWESSSHLGPYTFDDAFETVKRNVGAIVKSGEADYIVVVYHGGFEEDPADGTALSRADGEDQGMRMLREIPGIDVLLAGHQHRAMCGRYTRSDGGCAVYAEPGVNGEFLAEVLIDKESGGKTVSLIRADGEADDGIMSCVSRDEEACQLWLDEKLGESEVDLLIRDEFKARHDKAQLVTFLNMVQMEASGAELSAVSLSSGAAGFNREMTMRDLLSTYRFSNTLVVKRISGRILRAYLEKCAMYWTVRDGRCAVSPEYTDPPKDFDYDMLDGVEYVLDITRPVGERVVSLLRHGRDVEPDDEFTIVVNSYRAAGGGGFDMIGDAPVVSEVMRDVSELIASYVIERKVIDFDSVSNIKVLPQ